MPRRRVRSARAALLAAACLATLARAAHAQDVAPASDRLRLGGDAASAWSEGATRVVLIDGNATIRSDDSQLSADRAILWLTPVAGGGYDVKLALLGKARVVRGDVTREGGELYVTLATRPDVELSVADLGNRDRSTNVYFLAGAQLRRQAERGELTKPLDVTQAPPRPSTSAATGEVDAYDPTAGTIATTLPAATRPTTGPVTELPKSKQGTVFFRADQLSSKERTPDGRIAVVISGNVLLIQQRGNGDRVELQAQKAVVFTRWTDEKQVFESGGVQADRDFDSVYLEDDVRIALTPGDAARPEQTLRASKAVYEFGTDRAVLTDALLHSYDPAAAAPIVMRAREMRKLGTDTYEANKASITTSNFATPSLSLSAAKVTVRQDASTDGSTRTVFRADHVTPRLFGVPVFYFPILYGTSTDGGLPLRQIQITNSSGFGTGLATNWGLFETFGRQPPPGVDASYRADYYSERGPALGFDTSYAGGFVDESSLQPYSFNGGLTAYGTIDHGADKLGRYRSKPQFDDDFRGRIRWQHQQFLSDGWQVQAQAAYVSDPTFLEEWFRNEFRNGLEQDTSLYLKRSVGNEVFSVVGNANFSDIATTADQLQEVTPNRGDYSPITVERLPQVEYHKLGESFGDDRFTWVSNNSAAGLHFNESYSVLSGNSDVANLGLRNRTNDSVVDSRTDFVGVPSYGYTGYTGQYVVRGDSRQEVAMPMGDDRVRFTPFVVGRYTAYSESPAGGAEDRLLAGVGFRTSTQFSKTYDNVRSTLFDLTRVRHIVEPQASVFASASTTDRDDLYIYDENVDGINDVVGAQFAIRQRFQTKRGGEGRYRSVDFLTLNTGVNVFAHTYDEPGVLNDSSSAAGDNGADDARSFRGIYYDSAPEASLARSTLFADSAWRVTDTTTVLGDVAWNLEDQNLATAAVGLAVQREPRTRYFAGVRYIGEINSTIGTVTFDYNLSERYSVALNQSFNLSEGQNQSTSMELIRRFEQFIFTVTVYFDQIEDEGGVQFSISPRDFPVGVNTRGKNTGRS